MIDSSDPSSMRRRPVPERTVGDQIALARPGGGSALVLGPTAALVWSQLQGWRVMADLEQVLAEHYPDIPPAERQEALEEILRLLQDEGLLERSTR